MFYVALLAILLPIQNNLPFRSLNRAVLVWVGMIKLERVSILWGFCSFTALKIKQLRNFLTVDSFITVLVVIGK